VVNVPLYPGATVAMSGWALDQSAQGWAGFDTVQIYNGVPGQGGTVIGTGSVGLARPDIARTYGPAAVTSGWTAVATVPRLPQGSTYQQLPINVAFHTPSKGTYYVPGTILGSMDNRVQNESFQNGILSAPGYFLSSDFAPKFMVNATSTRGRAVNPICGYATDTQQFVTDGTAGIAKVDVILDGNPGNVLPSVDLGLADLTGCAGIAAPRGYAPDAGWQMTINETYYPPAVPTNPGPPEQCTYANCSKGSYQWPVGNHTFYVVETTKTGKTATLTIPFVVPS
jgi:hypothetical protein